MAINVTFKITAENATANNNRDSIIDLNAEIEAESESTVKCFFIWSHKTLSLCKYFPILFVPHHHRRLHLNRNGDETNGDNLCDTKHQIENNLSPGIDLFESENEEI